MTKEPICHRCHGRVILEVTPTHWENIHHWVHYRCLNCGNQVDDVILKHQQQNGSPL